MHHGIFYSKCLNKSSNYFVPSEHYRAYANIVQFVVEDVYIVLKSAKWVNIAIFI